MEGRQRCQAPMTKNDVSSASGSDLSSILDFWIDFECLFQFKFLVLHEFSLKVYIYICVVYTTSYMIFSSSFSISNFQSAEVSGFQVFEWVFVPFDCPLPSPPSVQDDPGF